LHEQTREALQSESMTRHTLAQQVIDLKERLAENDAYRHSLEEKHQHARDALDHYRISQRTARPGYTSSRTANAATPGRIATTTTNLGSQAK
jgi:hypothetical protein